MRFERPQQLIGIREWRVSVCERSHTAQRHANGQQTDSTRTVQGTVMYRHQVSTNAADDVICTAVFLMGVTTSNEYFHMQH